MNQTWASARKGEGERETNVRIVFFDKVDQLTISANIRNLYLSNVLSF